MELSYGELEDFLAEIHRVAPEKRTALKGRLKHFQRLGWPAGTNKGKGARVRYGIGQTMMLAMGMELLQLGLTPERVVLQFRYGSGMLADGFAEALKEYGPDSDDIFYVFSPQSLHSLTGQPLEDDEMGLRSAMTSQSEMMTLFQTSLLKSGRRFAFINISELLYRYIDYFAENGLGDPESLRKPIMNWQKLEDEANAKRMKKMVGDG